ncbi:MAG: protein kinase [Planctomycetes bacterium]|nr:protein kinase [Planctomycetota bacterium]
MPDPSIDLMLGRLLVGRGLVTPQQITRCLARQNAHLKEGRRRHLGQIVVEMGLVEKERVEEILRLQYRKEILRDEMIFGRIAVKNGIVTEEQVEECLRIQKLVPRSGEMAVPRLGELLIEKGYATVADTLAVLRAQHRMRASAAARGRVGEESSSSAEATASAGEGRAPAPGSEEDAIESYTVEELPEVESDEPAEPVEGPVSPDSISVEEAVGAEYDLSWTPPPPAPDPEPVSVEEIVSPDPISVEDVSPSELETLRILSRRSRAAEPVSVEEIPLAQIEEVGPGPLPATTPEPVSVDEVAVPTSDDVLVGRTFDGYEILERIAAGGMGTVYKAEQLSLNRIVAMKVLKAHLSGDTEYIHQFLREANAAARISHGNIIQIYDLGQFEGLYYLVMEYIDGRSLLDIVHRVGPLAPQRAADYCLQAARALAVGNREGIIHKDVKPENILVNRYGEVKVADYGLARIFDFQTAAQEKKKILGTVHYMSPEQIEGKKLDIRTDLYSLGVTLYELLTGKLPFDLENPMEIALAHLHQPIPRHEELPVPLPSALFRIVARLLEKDRDRRYQTPEDLIEELEGFLISHQRDRKHVEAKEKPPAGTTSQRKRRR